jgi:hypothetical protein
MDAAIQTSLMLRTAFKLALRQIEGCDLSRQCSNTRALAA